MLFRNYTVVLTRLRLITLKPHFYFLLTSTYNGYLRGTVTFGLTADPSGATHTTPRCLIMLVDVCHLPFPPRLN